MINKDVVEGKPIWIQINMNSQNVSSLNIMLASLQKAIRSAPFIQVITFFVKDPGGLRLICVTRTASDTAAREIRRYFRQKTDLAEQFSDLLSILGSVDVPESSRFLLSFIHPPFRHFIHIALLNSGHDLWRTKQTTTTRTDTHKQGTKGSSTVSSRFYSSFVFQ